MQVVMICNDCNQTWTLDDCDLVDITPKDGPYKNYRIIFKYSTLSNNMSSCPNCGSKNTKIIA